MDTNVTNLLRNKAAQLRIDSVHATSESGTGHPTSCCSAADVVAALFFHVMRYDPKNPKAVNNDRFILSKGHAAPLLYSAWSEAGLFPREELLKLRTLGSDLEGHPTPRLSFADVATGSLGQGLSVGVGMAINAKFVDKLDYRTYVLMGDGESAEGSVWEAAALASYYKLDNLCAIIDCNRLGQSQPTMLEHKTEVYQRRFKAFGWNSLVVDGHNLDEILAAFTEAGEKKRKPTAIIARTLKGKGISFCEDKEGWHGRALKKGEEMDKAIAELEAQKVAGVADKPTLNVPTVAELKPSPVKRMAKSDYKLGDLVASREAYGTALANLGTANKNVVAMDGDTKNSTYADRFKNANPKRYFECFIAEQNLVGVAVGMATRGKIPFVSTFACFLSRAYDQIRMAGISQSNLKLCGSHAGVSIGEDGPSQMALEDIAMMRAVAGCVVFHPSDAVSTEAIVEIAANHKGIVFIRTARPKNPVLYSPKDEFKIGGSRVLAQAPTDKVTVVATGVTVHEARKALEMVKGEGITFTIIDAYSIKPIDKETIRAAAAKTNNTIITVEDHYIQGGLGDAVLEAVADAGMKVHKIAVTELPRSGKPDELMEKFGISAKKIAEKVRGLSR
ncbi:MAG: transketolase [Verrucomicrobiae bacterium]|nr:transketolase [Verrucomicrobiae bacterium]